MFWKSIIEGVATLAHWQVWIAAIVYMVVIFVFLFLTAKAMGVDEYGDFGGGRLTTGCLLQSVGLPILHGIVMSFMIIYLLPILLGGQSAFPISAILGFSWPVIKIGVLAVVVVIIISVIPGIGALIAGSPGTTAFLMGIIIFRLLSKVTIDPILDKAGIQSSIYPGFWLSIGFLIIAGIFVRVVAFILALTLVPFKDSETGEVAIEITGSVFGIMGGFIPLFMYTSYVKLSLINLFPSG